MQHCARNDNGGSSIPESANVNDEGGGPLSSCSIPRSAEESDFFCPDLDADLAVERQRGLRLADVGSGGAQMV